MGYKKEDKINLSDFQISDSGQVLSCPQGHAPSKVKRKKRNSVGFTSDLCENCPKLQNCSVKKGKKFYYLRFTKKELRLAKRRIEEQTLEFKDRYRWRAGVEATMSELDRRTGVKNLRVRGFKSVRFCVILKAIGVNLLRAAAVHKAKSGDQTHKKGDYCGLYHAISFIKERFWMTWGHLRYLKDILSQFTNNFDHMLKIGS